jgi:hypothetical protein
LDAADKTVAYETTDPTDNQIGREFNFTIGQNCNGGEREAGLFGPSLRFLWSQPYELDREFCGQTELSCEVLREHAEQVIRIDARSLHRARRLSGAPEAWHAERRFGVAGDRLGWINGRLLRQRLRRECHRLVLGRAVDYASIVANGRRRGTGHPVAGVLVEQHRIHSPIGDIPPAEFETAHYARKHTADIGGSP